jgi:hypothetical protein
MKTGTNDFSPPVPEGPPAGGRPTSETFRKFAKEGQPPVRGVIFGGRGSGAEPFALGLTTPKEISIERETVEKRPAETRKNFSSRSRNNQKRKFFRVARAIDVPLTIRRSRVRL